MKNISYEELAKKYEALQNEIRYFQEYDSMTSLLNKNTFYKMAKTFIQENAQHKCTIFCIDVERFKVVNDIFGTEKGNELLIYLADHLQGDVFSEDSIVARISADVFVTCSIDKGNTNQIIEDIITVFNKAPLSMQVSPAIGIYQVQDPNTAVETMCDRAIFALNTIKGNYQKHFAIYDDKMWEKMLKEQEIRSQADRALENHEFQVYMQPKCNMRTGKVVGAEALVRWIHPEKGIIPPNSFIPVFERNGFIKKLDAYVWEEVIKWLHERSEKELINIPISLNVSRLDILGLDVPVLLQGMLKKYSVVPSFVQLEITESAYTSQFSEIASTVEKLMRLGHIVLMDDFGSGYSSLNMLKDINIDILKLDLRFLESTNQKSRDIIESIVHMAKWLNLKVIAEGVETKEQESFLLSIGCEFAQGFLYYKPMPLEDFNTLLTKEDIISLEEYENDTNIDENIIHFKDLFHNDMMSESLLNNILGGIALYQYDENTLQLIRCNEEYLHLTHHSPTMMKQGDHNLFEFIHSEDQILLTNALAQAKDNGDRGTSVILRKYIENTYRWFEFRLFYLADTNNKSIYYAGISDKNEEMEFYQRLRLSEQRFRIAMEASRSTLFEVDIETRVATFAKHTQEEFGLEDTVADAPEGFIKQGSVVEGYEDTFREVYNKIYRGEDYATCVVQANMGDGNIVWNRITLIAVKDESGKTLKAVGLVENVTSEIALGQKMSNS